MRNDLGLLRVEAKTVRECLIELFVRSLVDIDYVTAARVFPDCVSGDHEARKGEQYDGSDKGTIEHACVEGGRACGRLRRLRAKEHDSRQQGHALC